MGYSTSGSPSPSSPATIRYRSIVDQLQTGYHAAEQLRRRLISSSEVKDLSLAGVSLSDADLTDLILNSFNKGLAIARSSDCSSSRMNSRFSSKIEDSGDESLKIKDRRGCYKRRKRGQTWITEGETPTEDGHAWRKYGQKMILNSKFPRNYYRCTHKIDQGCLALKQVQKISDEPPLYRTTYAGEHTCENPHKTPEFFIPPSSPDQSNSSILVSFERALDPHISPYFPPSIKEELPNATASTTPTPAMNMMNMMMINQSSSDYNYFPSPDPTGGDVISVGTYSCSASPTSLEIDDYMVLGDEDHLDLIQFE